MQATIKRGKHTEGHGAWLCAHGYEVKEEAGRFVIEVPGGFVEKIDLSQDPVGELKKVIVARQLFTYSTVAAVGDGKTRKSIMLCGFLGVASALVAKPMTVKKGESVFAAL